jgi:HKD family nuclease
MLLHGEKYFEKVSDLIKTSNKIRISVAFWGAGSESLFDGAVGKQLQIVCNLSMGGSNPSVIEKLMAMKNVEVRQLDQLHAKLVLSDKGMVVGSANMSANGLGFEGKESDSFYELGIYSADSSLLEEANNWFDKKWNESRSIDDNDIEVAKEEWLKRRGLRPYFNKNNKGKMGVMEIDPTDLKDRQIYFVIYRNKVSEKAIDYLNKIAEREELSDGKLDIYEGWDEGQLPRQHDDILIPIYVGVRGSVEIDSPQRPVPELRNANDDMPFDFTIIAKENSDALPFRFGEKDRRIIIAPFKKWFDECLKAEFEKNECALCKPVSEFLEWNRFYKR